MKKIACLLIIAIALSSLTYAEQDRLLNKLKKDIHSQMPDEDINSVTKKDNVYEIRYTFFGYGDPIIDYGSLEDFVYRIMDVFIDNDVKDFKEIRIIASTRTPLKRGIISEAVVTKNQALEYGKNPIRWATYNTFKKFTFDEDFFLPVKVDKFRRWRKSISY